MIFDNLSLTFDKDGRIATPKAAWSAGKRMKNSLLLMGTAMLAACATSPDAVERLAVDRDALFATAPQAPAEWSARGVAGIPPKGDWLSQFNDPVMEALVAEALAANPTLESRAALTRASALISKAGRGSAARSSPTSALSRAVVSAAFTGPAAGRSAAEPT